MNRRHSTIFIIFCLVIVSLFSLYAGRALGRYEERQIVKEAYLLNELVLRGRLDTCELQNEVYLADIRMGQMQKSFTMEQMRASLGLDGK